MTRALWWLVSAPMGLGLNLGPAAASPPMAIDAPPPTRVEVVVDTLHGVAIPDPYRWLEDQESPETRAWIATQNAHTRRVLGDLPELPALQRRLADLRRIDRVGSRPRERAGRFFMWRKRADDDLWILYVREGLDGEDRVLLDPHPLSPDHTTSIELLAISPDGTRVAYGIREGGEDEVSVRVLDVDARQDLPDRLPRGLYTSVAFTAGNEGLVYGVHHRDSGSRIYRHRMGAPVTDDEELFGADHSPDIWISTEVSDDGRYALIVAYHGWSRSQLYLKDLLEDGPIVTLVDDEEAMFLPQFAGPHLVVSTDWEAPRRRVLLIDPARPERESWKEVVPTGPDPIEDVSTAGGRLYVHTLHDVISRIEVFTVDGHSMGTIDLPGPGSAGAPAGRWESDHAFLSFQSFTRPRTVYHLDVPSGTLDVWARDAIPFPSDDHVTEQVWYTSRDGTRVPMFLVHRKGLERTADHPTLLHGYGGFNVSQTPAFSTRVAVWLEGGGVYAVANIRGGGEFGEAWHRAGMLEKKQNVFDDFIAAAEWLIENDITRADRLAISGGSNGGLLVGAALTQRPELIRAVLCEYPDLDMIGYYRFPMNNAPALLEYGDASDPEQFPFLYAYSPYQRVTDGIAYPAILFTTGDADTRVPPLQARKMTARVQAASTSGRPVLLLYDTRAGHAGGKPLSKQIEDTALTLGFLRWQLGMSDPPAADQNASSMPK